MHAARRRKQRPPPVLRCAVQHAAAALRCSRLLPCGAAGALPSRSHPRHTAGGGTASFFAGSFLAGFLQVSNTNPHQRAYAQVDAAGGRQYLLALFRPTWIQASSGPRPDWEGLAKASRGRLSGVLIAAQGLCSQCKRWWVAWHSC